MVCAVPVAGLLIYLAPTVVFARTSSVCIAWERQRLFGSQLEAPVRIAMLPHSLYDTPTRGYYQTLTGTFAAYAWRLDYVVNPENYQVVAHLTVPADIAWISRSTYIAVPRKLMASQPPLRGD